MALTARGVVEIRCALHEKTVEAKAELTKICGKSNGPIFVSKTRNFTTVTAYCSKRRRVMQSLTTRFKGIQALIVGLSLCVLDTSADTKDESVYERAEKKPPASAQRFRPCEFTRWCLDAEMITTKNLYVEQKGRFSQIAIGLPRSHEINDALEVNGKIVAEEILVEAVGADYVFNPSYDLRPLEVVESFVNEHHHLPGIPSSASVESAGGKIPIGDSYRGLLEKIEELTLYTIEQEKRIAALERLLVDQDQLKSSLGGRHWAVQNR